MKKIIILIVIAGMLYGVLDANPNFMSSFAKQQSTASDSAVERAFKSRKSDVQVCGTGVVIRTLLDDNIGS